MSETSHGDATMLVTPTAAAAPPRRPEARLQSHNQHTYSDQHIYTVLRNCRHVRREKNTTTLITPTVRLKGYHSIHPWKKNN